MLPNHLSRDYSTKPAHFALLPSAKSAFQITTLLDLNKGEEKMKACRKLLCGLQETHRNVRENL